MWFKYGLKAQKLQKQHALKGRMGQNLRKFSHIIFYFKFCLNQLAIWRSRWLRVLPPEMP